MIEVVYKGDKLPNEAMPLSTFNLIKTPDPQTDSFLREKRYEKLIMDLAGLCVENDIKFQDLAHVGKALVNKLEDAFERASLNLWVGDDKRWVSGIDYRWNLSLLQADDILKRIKPDGKSE